MTSQYWIDGDSNSDERQLVVLTDEAIYAADYGKAQLDVALRELEAGKSPATLFDKKAKHVPLRSLIKVQIDANDESLECEWREGDKNQDTSIHFNAKEKRDAVFATLQARLQGRFQHGHDEMTPVRAAIGPLSGLTFFGVGTWLAVHAATAVRAAGEIEVEGRKKGLKMLIIGLLDLLGPVGVGIVGGILTAITAWYLIVKVRNPPRIQVLQEKPYTVTGPFLTGIKYAALVGVWAIAARIIF